MLARTRFRVVLCAVILVSIGAVCAFGEKKPAPQPLNLNTATPAQLQQLPGVGPAIARAIIDYRTAHGPFRRVEELLIIRGISRARLRRLRPYIRVN